MRSRQRSQAVVEFGIVAIAFTLIMFAIADFGLLLNDWLTVSSGVNGLARDASVGLVQTDLVARAKALRIPGVTNDPHFAGYCCDPNDAVQLSIIYYDQCTPGVGTCLPVTDGTTLRSGYWSGTVQGTCSIVTPPCAHPAPPGPPGGCTTGPGNPCPGDSVVVTLTAAGAQVITPLVRPFFGQPNQCPDSSYPSHCWVPLSSTVTMRFLGTTL